MVNYSIPTAAIAQMSTDCIKQFIDGNRSIIGSTMHAFSKPKKSKSLHTLFIYGVSNREKALALNRLFATPYAERQNLSYLSVLRTTQILFISYDSIYYNNYNSLLAANFGLSFCEKTIFLVTPEEVDSLLYYEQLKTLLDGVILELFCGTSKKFEISFIVVENKFNDSNIEMQILWDIKEIWEEYSQQLEIPPFEKVFLIEIFRSLGISPGFLSLDLVETKPFSFNVAASTWNRIIQIPKEKISSFNINYGFALRFSDKDLTVPQKVTNIISMSIGYEHFVIASTRGLFAYGNNRESQIGDARKIFFEEIIEIKITHLNVKMVTCGHNFTAYLLSNGNVLLHSPETYKSGGIEFHPPIPMVYIKSDSKTLIGIDQSGQLHTYFNNLDEIISIPVVIYDAVCCGKTIYALGIDGALFKIEDKIATNHVINAKYQLWRLFGYEKYFGFIERDGTSKIYNSKNKLFLTQNDIINIGIGSKFVLMINKDRLLVCYGKNNSNQLLYDKKTSKVKTPKMFKLTDFKPSTVITGENDTIVIGNTFKIPHQAMRYFGVTDFIDKNPRKFRVKSFLRKYDSISTPLVYLKVCNKEPKLSQKLKHFGESLETAIISCISFQDNDKLIDEIFDTEFEDNSQYPISLSYDKDKALTILNTHEENNNVSKLSYFTIGASEISFIFLNDNDINIMNNLSKFVPINNKRYKFVLIFLNQKNPIIDTQKYVKIIQKNFGREQYENQIDLQILPSNCETIRNKLKMLMKDLNLNEIKNLFTYFNEKLLSYRAIFQHELKFMNEITKPNLIFSDNLTLDITPIDIKSIGLGLNHLILIYKKNLIYVIGDDTNFQIGTKERKRYENLTEIKFDKLNNRTIKRVFCGDNYSLYLLSDGSLMLCSIDCNYEPYFIKFKSPVVYISGSPLNPCCIDLNGEIHLFKGKSTFKFNFPERPIDISFSKNYTFVLTEKGECYISKNYSSFQKFKNFTEIPIKRVFGLYKHLGFITENGKAFITGWTEDKLPYKNELISSDYFFEIRYSNDTFKEIHFGQNFVILLTEDNKMYALGSNSNGQLLPCYDNSSKTIQLKAKVNNIISFSTKTIFMINNINTLKRFVTYNTNIINQYIPKEEVKTFNDINTFISTTIRNAHVINVDKNDKYYFSNDSNVKVYGCGDNTYKQICNNEIKDKPYLMPINYDNILNITAGNNHSVFLYKNNTILVIGDDNKNKIGTNKNKIFNDYVKIEFENYIIQNVKCGDNYTLYLTTNNELIYCSIYSSQPQIFKLPTKIIYLSTSAKTFCAIDSNGDLYMNVTNTQVQKYKFPCKVYDVASNMNLTIVITIDGKAYKIVDDKIQLINELSNYICNYVFGYYQHIAVLTNGGQVFMCGENNNLQLGTETIFNINFEECKFLSSLKIETMALGKDFSLFITKDNRVFGCGSNKLHQLFLFDETNAENLPKSIKFFNDLTPNDIISGSQHSFIICNNLPLKHLGLNYFLNQNLTDFSINNFVVTNQIGNGILGKTFRIYHKENGLILSAKFLNNVTQGLRNQILYLAKLLHPCVLKYYGCDFNFSNSNVLYSMYRIEGSLKDSLSKLNSTQKVINLIGVAFGLRFLHRFNIIHGNLKCSNVMLNSQRFPMISDYGLVSGTIRNDLIQFSYMFEEIIGTNSEFSEEFIRYCQTDPNASFDNIIRMILKYINDIASNVNVDMVKSYCNSVIYYENKLFGNK